LTRRAAAGDGRRRMSRLLINEYLAEIDRL
jgi:hypothetical protein